MPCLPTAWFEPELHNLRHLSERPGKILRAPMQTALEAFGFLEYNAGAHPEHARNALAQARLRRSPPSRIARPVTI